MLSSTSAACICNDIFIHRNVQDPKIADSCSTSRSVVFRCSAPRGLRTVLCEAEQLRRLMLGQERYFCRKLHSSKKCSVPQLFVRSFATANLWRVAKHTVHRGMARPWASCDRRNLVASENSAPFQFPVRKSRHRQPSLYLRARTRQYDPNNSIIKPSQLITGSGHHKSPALRETHGRKVLQ